MKLKHKEALIKDLQTLVRFPSALSDPVGEYPYGKAIGQSLEWFFGVRERIWL